MRSSYGTQQRLDQARTDRDRASASVASAAAAVTSAESAIDVLQAEKVEAEKVGGELQTARAMAERNLAFTEVKAPFDGTVGNKSVEPGQYVQPGTRLMALVPLDSALCRGELQGDAGRPAEARSTRDHPAGRLWRPRRRRHGREPRPGLRAPRIFDAAARERDRQLHQDRPAPAGRRPAPNSQVR